MPIHPIRPRRFLSTVAGLTLLAGATLPAALRAEAVRSEASSGPDVTIIYVGGTSSDTTNWGAVGGIRAYSVGTTSCNVGTAPIAWCDAGTCLGGTLQANDHPVIAQNMYKLKDGRFSQVGMSWLKHGWLSTNSPNGACSATSCTTPPGGGDQLGVGCTDTYGSGLNGGSGNPGTCDSGSCRLGQRSAVNPTTGDFPMPYVNIAHPSVIDQRIQVPETDLDPTLNSGATYYMEGQYIAGDDGFAGNAFNNASYRLMTVGGAPNFNLSLSGATVREKTALEAWPVADPAVELIWVDVPGSSPVERFQVARRISQIDVDTWHYEYAIRNMNSDRAARALSIQFPSGTPLANVGFKDIDPHSSEIYATTDWVSSTDSLSGVVSWTGVAFATDPNANALRFATLFNFWFDADSALPIAHTLTLFKPGSPATVSFWGDNTIFVDGFESDDFSAWSATAP
ncbi:MAG: hypothetical protein ABI689_06760 [Thermoanaerobaculia bacterium]